MKKNYIVLFGLILSIFLFMSFVSANSDNSTIEEINSIDEDIVVDELGEDGSLQNEEIEVEVSNVFHGYENTIKVSKANATGTVDITVGDKTYSPEFVDGVATQNISEYVNGVNNVNVRYNNITMNSSFKVLDGIVNYTTFYDYFDENNRYYLYDYIPQGVTLDFQGDITYINLNKTDDNNLLHIIINKPINIISTTKDAFIDFNCRAGSLLGESPGSRFSIGREGAWSNVTGITIHNTQVILANTHHVVLDNVSVIIEDQRVGSGIGATSLRANSTYCVVKNSYFYTRNNGGSSSLVMAWADYCTFDNNTVVGEGNVGNLIYTTTYNVDIPEGVKANCHNNLTNNRIYGPAQDASICYGLCISGDDTLVENNTIYYSGSGIATQWVDSSWPGGDAIPYYNRYIGNKLYGGCDMTVAADSIAYNNFISGKVSIFENSKFYNNTVEKGINAMGKNVEIFDVNVTSLKVSKDGSIIHDCTIDLLTADGDNLIFYDNIINNNELTINSENIQFVNCTIFDLTLSETSLNVTLDNNEINGFLSVASNRNTITNNKIISNKEYAIDLKNTIRNVVTNNYVLSSTKYADDAILPGRQNTVKDNYPIAPDVLIDVELIDNFENIVTVTVPNSTGSISIQVSDKKYTLTLSDGIATQRISGLDPGNYTLTVDYQDDKTPIYASNSTILTVPKIDVYTFELAENEFMEGNVVVPVNLPSDSDGKIVINGIFEGINNIVLNYTEGEYDLEIRYTDSQRYADKSIIAHIKVKHNPKAILTLEDVSTYYTTGKVTIKLMDYKLDAISNTKIIVALNSKVYEVKTDENGIAAVDYSLGLGTYKISADFEGDENYNSTSAEATLKVLSRFSGNKNIVMNYYDGSKYSVRVLDDSGKFSAGQLVTFNINGKISTVTTDNNGYATLSITDLPGKYAVTATYKGQTVKNTVQVKQNLKASKVTVKKSAKKLVLKATLSKVKGKKLTFKFNGKTYTAKTDKNGVAKVTIKKNVIKKLKKGKKYAFTVKYVSNTVKNNVIVK